MRRLFPGYPTYTQEEFKEIWLTAVFSFDANVLLNIHRVDRQGRDQFLESLRKLQDRVWVTHQSAFEFEKNQKTVIDAQHQEYGKTSSETLAALSETQEVYRRGIAGQKQQLEELTKNLQNKKHSYFDHTAVINILEQYSQDITLALGDEAQQITAAYDRRKQELDALLQEGELNRSTPQVADKLRAELFKVLEGKIGEAYTPKRLAEIYKEAEVRYEGKIPPGHEDNEKGFPDMYGDVVIWYQLLDFAKEQHPPRSLIFVTDDAKGDWLRKDKRGQKQGPRLELLLEMAAQANTTFYLYNFEQYLKYAQELLGHETLEVSKQAEEIRQKDWTGYELYTDDVVITSGSVRADAHPPIITFNLANENLSLRTDGYMGRLQAAEHNPYRIGDAIDLDVSVTGGFDMFRSGEIEINGSRHGLRSSATEPPFPMIGLIGTVRFIVGAHTLYSQLPFSRPFSIRGVLKGATRQVPNGRVIQLFQVRLFGAGMAVVDLEPSQSNLTHRQESSVTDSGTGFGQELFDVRGITYGFESGIGIV